MEHRVELLAPAGNYEAFRGAVNAGADAVYLGGEKFGARAYADNFSTEEICKALRTAHVMGRKIYLTVNTLIKESEFDELYDYMLPFYEAGLDGVIIQDMGVFSFFRERFPDLPLHASTQMTLTGVRGAIFLKSQGAVRIVPARELSLSEIRQIKETTGMEVECFVHGAMCYCYSGQCLFSSILGGRSGNRGRCAQPCRLSYQIYEDGTPVSDVCYPLSLKDMCTLHDIPKLIDAGIDSFKIEGRMKKPEYAAGVTALYRKYIDRYYELGTEHYRVEEQDFAALRTLYIRSEIQTGYYDRHNGREMLTLHKPGYTGSDETLLAQIREQYLHEPEKTAVSMDVTLKVGEPICLTVTHFSNQGISVSVTGDVAEEAQKTPMQENDIRKQLVKTGNSCVTVSECHVQTEGQVFVPVRSLNQLRRKAVAAFEQEMICKQGLTAVRYDESFCAEKSQSMYDDAAFPEKQRPLYGNASTSKTDDAADRMAKTGQTTDCLVSNIAQLRAVLSHPVRRIYIDSDLYLRNAETVRQQLAQAKPAAQFAQSGTMEFALALPYVLRARDEAYLGTLREKLKEDDHIRGFLVRSLDGAAFVRELGTAYFLVPDAGLYSFNQESIRFWAKYSNAFYLPYEANAKEAALLTRKATELGMESSMVVYGWIPMMITANCLKKTSGRCTQDQKGSGGQSALKDRLGTMFPVETNCVHCYNIIYNSVPYSLHLKRKELERIGAAVHRYDFVMEDADACHRILSGSDFPCKEYTTGHLKRGIE
jgi:putative protease